jgi:tRNA (guanine-N7-)-methyltransferase
LADQTPPGSRRRQLYGRRKGPKLSPHQASLFRTLLPGLSLPLEPGRDARSYFTMGPVRDAWLEVGFGGGEHLLWQAQHHPDVGFIGAEPYEAGVAKLLSRLAFPGTAGFQPASMIHSHQTRAGSPRSQGENIRIHQGDAREVIDALPDASLGRVFVLFPDPWPKTRHHKRRFIQMDTLDALARVMRPGAELRFASDDPGYIAWTLERLQAHSAFAWTAMGADDWTRRPANWPPTRYEEKALHGSPVFLEFRRRPPNSV